MQPNMNPAAPLANQYIPLPGNPAAPAARQNWMTAYQAAHNNTQITDLTIPGTHESGTAVLSQGGRIIEWFRNIVQCQDQSITTQLNMGIRFLDIRVSTGLLANGAVQLAHIVHDGPNQQLDINCLNPLNNNYLALNDVVNLCHAFLQVHPGETIIMSIKPANSAIPNLPAIIAELNALNAINGPFPNIFYNLPAIPTLAQAQGHIVLLRRFPLPAGNPLPGFDFSAWNAQAAHANPVNGSFVLPAAPAMIQDKFNIYDFVHWDVPIANKIAFFINSNNAFNGLPLPKPFFLNFASCTMLGYVRRLADNINAQILAMPFHSLHGCVIMDFPDQAVIDKIINDN